MFIVGNEVFDNQNKIPYYNANYDDPEYMKEKNMHVARENYGSKAQTFIIDGSGVYISRNSQTYSHGKYDLSFNECYRNGINGMVVHKTDRARIIGNLVYENGQVPKSSPEERQSYAGITLNNANDVILRDNYVEITDSSDQGYTNSKSKFDEINSGNNKLCNGRMASVFKPFVTKTCK